jgi:SET domain-containing protein
MADFEIRKTEEKGWGVFALRDFQADEFVESAPVIVMSAAEMELLNQTKLHDYIFHWEGDQCCMAMGNIPIFNHAAPSNCEYFQDYEAGIIEIKTVHFVQKGEELTINYNGDASSQQSVWFKTN